MKPPQRLWFRPADFQKNPKNRGKARQKGPLFESKSNRVPRHTVPQRVLPRKRRNVRETPKNKKNYGEPGGKKKKEQRPVMAV